MKISGTEKIILAATAAFLVLAGGYFLGDRGSDGAYTVDTQTVWNGETGESVPVFSPPVSVNINTATVEQLQSLPGIGTALAQDIVAEREANGPFCIPEDLMRVSSVGEGTLSNVLKYITVE